MTWDRGREQDSDHTFWDLRPVLLLGNRSEDTIHHDRQPIVDRGKLLNGLPTLPPLKPDFNQIFEHHTGPTFHSCLLLPLYQTLLSSDSHPILAALLFLLLIMANHPVLRRQQDLVGATRKVVMLAMARKPRIFSFIYTHHHRQQILASPPGCSRPQPLLQVTLP